MIPSAAAQGAKPDAARKQAESLALSGVKGAAEAQATIFIAANVRERDQNPTRITPSLGPAPSTPTTLDLPQPKALPRPGTPPIIRVRVVSVVPSANESDADKDALTAAQDAIERGLAELDPPVRYRPSTNEVEKEFLRRDSRTVRPPSPAEKEVISNLAISGNPVYVEYDVEVTSDQVRHLRTRDRIGDTLRILGVVAAMALAGFLFLRADEWTKGYLTRWLAMGAVLLAGGAAAALYFV